jgi:hypothetical protein
MDNKKYKNACRAGLRTGAGKSERPFLSDSPANLRHPRQHYRNATRTKVKRNQKKLDTGHDASFGRRGNFPGRVLSVSNGRIIPQLYSTYPPGGESIQGRIDDINHWIAAFASSLIHHDRATASIDLRRKGLISCTYSLQADFR